MKNKITVNGYSDDTIVMLVYVDDIIAYEQDFGTDNVFKVNGHFAIHTIWDDTHGFIIGVSIINEDFKIDSRYDLSLIQDTDYTHTPRLVVETDEPIKIEGLYGDTLSQVKGIFSMFVHESIAEDIISELKKNGLLNI